LCQMSGEKGKVMQSPKIIFEDNSILVLNKPSGWITNSASTTTDKPVVQGWLKSNFEYPISNVDSLRSGIVHRLDKETSGILVVAKTKEAFEILQKEFKERQVKKTYIALVHGKFDLNEGEIKAAVGRLSWNRRRFGVLPGGREAITRYSVLRSMNYEEKEYSLLELSPKTGRTHQIRIHLKFIGHPIAADEFYAGRKTARSDREWCPRLFLHAATISFIHPVTGKLVSYKSDLPDDLKSVLDSQLQSN